MAASKLAAPKVAIITPVFNRISHTLEYLKCFDTVNYPSLMVVIVDDGSTDGTSRAVREQFPDVTVLQGDGNLWWAGATNLGIKHALKQQVDYVYTLNNDVVFDPQLISAVVECAENNPKSLVGSKIFYSDDREKVWFFGARFDDRTADIALIDGKNEDFPEISEVEMLTGMGMLIPAGAFAEFGLFDDKHMPQYLGDSDLSLRAKKAGYKLLVTPESKIYSDTGASWTISQIKKRNLSFIPQMFFSIRSPYKISVRYLFYKRHWGKGYHKALLRFYWLLIKNFAWPHSKDIIKGRVKQILRTKT